MQGWRHYEMFTIITLICAFVYVCKVKVKSKSKGSFYIAQYPVRWTAQSASHFLPSLTELFIPTPFSASPGSILARQQLRAKTKSLTFPPLSIARYSFIQLSEQGRLWSERKRPNLRNGSKGGFEPGLSRLRVRHSTTELLRSTCVCMSAVPLFWPNLPRIRGLIWEWSESKQIWPTPP